MASGVQVDLGICAGADAPAGRRSPCRPSAQARPLALFDCAAARPCSHVRLSRCRDLCLHGSCAALSESFMVPSGTSHCLCSLSIPGVFQFLEVPPPELPSGIQSEKYPKSERWEHSRRAVDCERPFWPAWSAAAAGRQARVRSPEGCPRFGGSGKRALVSERRVQTAAIEGVERFDLNGVSSSAMARSAGWPRRTATG